jgi:threonylcarbamoyladenosine tRNA methylthiotransferase MtaB
MAETQVVTFGCRLNIYESEVMKGLSKDAGLEDAIIFNTCAVTSEAERQARQAIRRARRDHPDKKIIVTGCAAQINPDKYAKMPEVDQVIGNHEKMLPTSFDPNQTARVLVNDIMTVKETVPHLVQSFDGKTRAFIEVQNGCDHRCTFCTIPLGRGNSRSVPVGVIVHQVKELVQQGFQEVVLTGVDVTSYGSDLPGATPLGQMIRRLLNNVPDLKRLRLSSIDPMEVDDDLFDLICHDHRLMPHVHLSVQAGHDMILKRMKRRHLRDDVIHLCDKIRAQRPDVVFGADIIAGFPTETDEMFQQTLDLVARCSLTYLHVFPYSPRPGTPAARMPQVEKAIIKERAKQLRALGDQKLTDFLKTQVGAHHQVLIEKDAHHGHAENFAPFYFDTPQTPGAILQAEAVSVENGQLMGRVIHD